MNFAELGKQAAAYTPRKTTFKVNNLGELHSVLHGEANNAQSPWRYGQKIDGTKIRTKAPNDIRST